MIINVKYERIIECLIIADQCTDPNFKHWVLKKGEFSIIEEKLYRMQTKGPKHAKITVNVPV